MDRPHTWLWMRDLSYTCLGCNDTRKPGFDPDPGRFCEHPDWLDTPNGILACAGYGKLAEG